MTNALKVSKKQAQEAKTYLLKNNLLDKNHSYKKDKEFLYFPLINGVEQKHIKEELKKLDATVVEAELEQREITTPSWREAAKAILTTKEYNAGRFSYDTVGTIAIIEIVDELVPKERELAELLLETDPQIKTVLKKAGGHEGEFRTQGMIHLAGEETKETMLKETNCKFTINVETVYFSIRLGTERKRILELIQPGEHILCMFSGAAPYPVVLAKNSEAAEVVGVEINPEGHKYGLKNVKLNKLTNVELHNGDVAQVVPEILKKRAEKEKPLFNRITMPLPHTGVEFLPIALQAIISGGTIHYYSFIDRDDLESEQQRIEKLIQDEGKKGTIEQVTLCGQHSPRRFRVCFDIKIK